MYVYPHIYMHPANSPPDAESIAEPDIGVEPAVHSFRRGRCEVSWAVSPGVETSWVDGPFPQTIIIVCQYSYDAPTLSPNEPQQMKLHNTILSGQIFTVNLHYSVF